MFCVPTNMMSDGTYKSIGVTSYPTSWAFVVAGGEAYRGFEYVRLDSAPPTIPEHHAYCMLVFTGKQWT